jgi:recombination protein RecA
MPTAVRLASTDEAAHDPTLDAALGQLQRRYGTTIGRPTAPEPVAVISTGSLDLDLALGIGGIPRGRLTEVYGPDGSGKTTLALSVIAQAQQAGGSACFIDAEHALDLAWSGRVGVDLDRLVLARPDDGEQALEVADVLVSSGGLDVLAIDSIAALVPRVELAGQVGDRHPGAQGNMLSIALRRLAGRIARNGTAVVVTNQLRQKSGTPGQTVYTAGGRALAYYASVRLDLWPAGPIREAGEVVGSRIHVNVTKNKTARPGGRPSWR